MFQFLKNAFSFFSRLNQSGQIPSSLTDQYDSLLTMTLRNLQPRIHDNISKSNKLVSWLIDKGLIQRESGGERIQVALMHAQNSTADIYSGYGTLDTTPQDGFTSAFYDWSQIAVSISISGAEVAKNSGKEAILKLLDSKRMQAEVSAKEILNNCIVAGRITSGATSAQGQFSARRGRLDSNAAGPLPLAALVDVTNSRNVAIGNINPNTYSFWRNQATASTATTFAGLKQEMNQVYNDCSKGTGGSPDLMVVDQRAWEIYFNSLQNQERFVVDNQKTLDVLGGSDALKFRGAVMVWDEVVPDPDTNAEVVDGIGTVGQSTIYYLTTPTWRYVVHQDRDFITTPFLMPVGQDAKVAEILWMGAIGVNNRRKNGVLSSISRTIAA